MLAALVVLAALAAPKGGEEQTPCAGAELEDRNARRSGAALGPSLKKAGAARDAAVHCCSADYWDPLRRCPTRRARQRRRLKREAQWAKQTAKQLAALAATFSAHENFQDWN